MFNKVSESTMHRTRWVLTAGWLLLIASLFYDTVSKVFTDPESTWSPLRIRPEQCITVQRQCLELAPHPLGAPLFWGIIVPSAIFVLLVFGHELWRRICPLSFLSQIPRALGWQRKIKRTDSKSGKVRYEIPKVQKNSWLSKNYFYIQFAYLFVGLCFRILFINGDRLALGLWLLTTIGAAVAVGYLYGGKTWCNYFCPMAPVQQIYAEPGGLLTSKAHMSDSQITQSMCRTTTEGKEQSACVACQSVCIDIDSERSYWDGIDKPETRILYYCYLGLVVGYFFYYYLYAGSWDYYFSGAWATAGNSLDELLSPGLFLYDRALPIPKLVAVPLVLGGFTALGYPVGLLAERLYRAYLLWAKQRANSSVIRHHIFSVTTFIAFNLFFVFGGRPFIRLLPDFFQEVIDALLILCSTLWLHRALRRDPELYTREGLAGRFRKQLAKMDFPIEQYFGDRAIDELNTHEVYVLVKVLPGFSKQKRYEAYKGVLRDALAEGYTDTASSLEVLRQLRLELDITDSEHRSLLEELGIEDPNLLDPNRQRSLENLVRISGYRRALERLVYLQKLTRANIDAVTASYGITSEEETEVILGLDHQAAIKQKALSYLDQLRLLCESYHNLNQNILVDQRFVVTLLLEFLHRKKRALVIALLETIATADSALEIATELGRLGTNTLQDILAEPDCPWHSRLEPEIIQVLARPSGQLVCPLDIPVMSIVETLTSILMMQESEPLVQAVSLYLLQKLDFTASKSIALELSSHPLLSTIVQLLLKRSEPISLADLPILERVVYLFHSDFFQSLDQEILIELAQRAYIKSYEEGELISEAGDTCRELLLLVTGKVEVHTQKSDGTKNISSLLPGKVLDELEVLAHSNLIGTIVAQATPTQVLAIPVDGFDDLLERDRYLALKVLELESNRLKDLLV